MLKVRIFVGESKDRKCIEQEMRVKVKCPMTLVKHSVVLECGGAPFIFTSVLGREEWSALHSGRFTPGEIVDWVGTRADLDVYI